MVRFAAVTPRPLIAPHTVVGEHTHVLADGRVRCDVCPRACTMREGQAGFCFVREARGGEVVMTSYGRASGFCVDPIEKKPLNHFYPGSSVLSFGTAGCNLGCRFCQNWDISKAREFDRLTDAAMPEDIAAAAARAGCKSVAFTYNDPVIWGEYATDTAHAAHERGLSTVAVTAGYITERARERFFAPMDAANVDLKAFTERFYDKLCFAHLGPVLDTLAWLKRETKVWLEVTTLLIPGENDSEAEVDALVGWFVEHLGPETPLHFSGFHPDFKLDAHPPTPRATLLRARQQALRAGLRHVYTGNVHDVAGQSTYCGSCEAVVIERDWYTLGAYRLTPEGECMACGAALAGRFAEAPGSWGAKRMRLPIAPGAPA
ncbi:MAG: AmmeMemoRadiSam system radical SAM enzyme [Sandaracinaceae bacterium]|nr:AmmeMemoRadiSam system radical SAM enzyme [Sandaracinaceae bacterium]